MFDTGAPTVLSTELAQLLSLKSQKTDKISDSQGNNNQQQFVNIPSMKIGSLVFKNTGALVVDLKGVFEFNCMNFDGIIGANQMATTIWEIDYRKKMLTVSNKLSNFERQSKSFANNFKKWQKN